MSFTFTNQTQLRKTFWREHPECDRTRRDGDYSTDTRCTFNDWIEGLRRNGDISEDLTYRVTL